jgi:MFS family permease
MGLQSSFGAFQQYYQKHLLTSYTAFDIAFIGTIQIFCSASGGIISGPLFDMGYDKLIVLLGCFFAVLAYMMTSLSTTYWQIFLAQSLCGGLAGTFVFAPALALIALSFQTNRALAVGITTSGFAFGAVIYPIVFRRLQPMLGFPWTTRIMAFIALSCFCIAYPLVYWKTPRSSGKIRKIFDVQAWKEAPYAIYCWAVFFMYAGYWPPFFYMAMFSSRAIGTSVDLAFYIFAIANAANTIARWTATLLADVFGIVEVLTVASAISTIIAFCWAAVSTSAGMIVWAVFWGYFSGVMSACFAAVVPSLSPSPDVVGARMGMLNGLFGIGCLISPPIAGALLSVHGANFERRGTYLDMQMYVGTCLTVATLLFIYPLMYVRRQRGQESEA